MSGVLGGPRHGRGLFYVSQYFSLASLIHAAALNYRDTFNPSLASFFAFALVLCQSSIKHIHFTFIFYALTDCSSLHCKPPRFHNPQRRTPQLMKLWLGLAERLSPSFLFSFVRSPLSSTTQSQSPFVKQSLNHSLDRGFIFTFLLF